MDITLSRTRGYVALYGKLIDNTALQSPSQSPPDAPYHITLLTKAEAQRLGTRLDDLLNQLPPIQLPINLGVGSRGKVRFNVIFWPQGNALRRRFDLPAKQFHITLTSTDDHAVDKGVTSITEPARLTTEEVELVIQDCISVAKNPPDRSSALDVARFIVTQHVSCLTDKSFDGAWRLLARLSSHQEASDLSSSYLSLHPDSIAANLRKADCCALPQEAKKAMHHYGLAAHLSIQNSSAQSSIPSLCVKGIVKCSEHTEYGPLFLEGESMEIQNSKSELSFFMRSSEAFRNPELRRMVQEQIADSYDLEDIDTLLSKKLSLSSNVRIHTPFEGALYKLPRFFRWLMPFRLAVMSTPRWKEDIPPLVAQKITLVVTLTEEEPLPASWFADAACRNVFIPVRNYQAPTVAQVDRFIRLMDGLPGPEAALVHCGGGKGRAGVFAACYLMARGFKLASTEEEGAKVQLYPADAIKLLRHMRPGSIETTEQESFIKRYAQHLINGQTTCEPEKMAAMDEPQIPLEISGSLPVNPSMIICCGIPGSGKSTFASVLAEGSKYTVISQDTLGSRGACLSAVSNALQTDSKILIDRCNPYVSDREQFLAQAFHRRDAVCIHFDVSPSLCITRADSRENHPTIPPGRAEKIVKSFVKTFETPDLKEKFACVVRVPSSSAATELLKALGVAEPIMSSTDLKTTRSIPHLREKAAVEMPQRQTEFFKFPRTRHLFNTGSATRDDLLFDATDATSFLNPADTSITLTLEEKIDGANLGISLSDTGFKVQNRSHYVTSKSHAQFKKIDKWLADRREGLNLLLRGPEGQWKEGKWVLFGEWMVARHSIAYTRLPDWFVAFDLFDTDTRTFCSRSELKKRLEGTGIHQVCQVDAPAVLDERSLLDIVGSQQSRYGDGVIEGLYLRRVKDGQTIDRAKIVRGDFIAGNEHWSRGNITLNEIFH